jgi:DNA-binding transcriptional ArsR family regulator
MVEALPPIAPTLAEIAALIGNPARANVLTALLDGRPLTAGELALAAHLTPQTTSGHLAQLTRARLLCSRRQGRHVYYRLASPLVCRMLEGIMAVAADDPDRVRPRWNGDPGLRTARTCYDHIAGRLGVALAEALAQRDLVVLSEEGGLVTEAGETFLDGFGIDLPAIRRGRRAFCRTCLDWSERRLHLAGALGAALADRCFALGWIARAPSGRALRIPEPGRRGFAARFGVRVDAWD